GGASLTPLPGEPPRVAAGEGGAGVARILGKDRGAGGDRPLIVVLRDERLTAAEENLVRGRPVFLRLVVIGDRAIHVAQSSPDHAAAGIGGSRLGRVANRLVE